MAKWRLYILGIVALLLVIGGADWMLANARLDDVVIDTQLDPPEVVADGQSTITISMRVTENGKPHAQALLQLWIDSGSGFLVPTWVITDDDGVAQSTFTPNVASPYDPHDEARIYVMDTSVGRIVEVGKRQLVHVPLVMPHE